MSFLLGFGLFSGAMLNWVVVSNIIHFHPYTPTWGRFPFWLYSIFGMGGNHQPVNFGGAYPWNWQSSFSTHHIIPYPLPTSNRLEEAHTAVTGKDWRYQRGRSRRSWACFERIMSWVSERFCLKCVFIECFFFLLLLLLLLFFLVVVGVFVVFSLIVVVS